MIALIVIPVQTAVSFIQRWQDNFERDLNTLIYLWKRIHRPFLYHSHEISLQNVIYIIFSGATGFDNLLSRNKTVSL